MWSHKQKQPRMGNPNFSAFCHNSILALFQSHCIEIALKFGFRIHTECTKIYFSRICHRIQNLLWWLFALKFGPTGGSLKSPKNMWRMTLALVVICLKIFKFPGIEHIHFRFFENQMRKWGISRFSNIKKRGISRKKHVINFKTGKEPKVHMFPYSSFMWRGR